MSIGDLEKHLGRVRQLTDIYLAGDTDAFAAFGELVNLLLRVTVLPGPIGVRLTAGPRPRDRMMVEGGLARDKDVVRLSDDRFLRVSVTLFREPHESGHRMKVERATYQYQLDEEGNHWVFRYDYVRAPRDEHPASHLQIRGNLYENVRLHKGLLERTHFPAGRTSIESVLRLLLEQFEVPPSTPLEIWRPVLAASEAVFERIAHRPLSGPVA